MRLYAISLAGLFLVVDAGRAGGIQGKLVEDVWNVAYVQGARIGYFHTQVWQTEKDGQKIYSSKVHLHLTVKRNADLVQMRMDMGMTETEDGKVLGLLMRQYLGKDKQMLVTGKVVGKQLQMMLDNSKPLPPAPWEEDVVGLYRQQHLLARRKVKPGDTFTYKSFEAAVNRPVLNQVQVKDWEDVELQGGKQHKKLLRVEVRPEKLEKVQLPTLLNWVDKNYEIQRSEFDMPGLGLVTLYKSNMATALGPASVANLTDVGISQQIRLRQRILRAYDTKGAVYRITVQKDEDPASTFSRDDRQQVKNVRGNTFELYVRASAAPAADASDKKSPGEEYTQSSYFINSADEQVKALARQAVGNETDPWRKALLIEKWVNRNLKAVSDEAMATADHVARTLKGDCTEYSMLTAAMCRAQGIPAKTAIGLIYADVDSGPVFAFHMWTEVWIKGVWVPIDATLGRGYVGAAHLKITDHSWNDTRTLTPLFPLIRVLGRLGIEVLRVE